MGCIMRLQRKITTGILGGEDAYWKKVRQLFGSTLIAYWPLWETSGTVAQDFSGNGRNAAYVNTLTLAGATSQAGKPCPTFVDGQVNLYSTSFKDAILPALKTTGFISLYLKTSAAENWLTGAAEQYALDISAPSTTDYLRILINPASVQRLIWLTIKMGGTSKVTSFYTKTLNWMHFFVTWDNVTHVADLWINGVYRSSITGMSDFTASVTDLVSTYCCLGGLRTTTDRFPWLGNKSDCIFGTEYVTDTNKVMALASAKHRPVRVSILGDSISALAATVDLWHDVVFDSYRDGITGVMNHAVGGASIITDVDGDADMDAQVVSAASDDADIIIIELGTNDTETGEALTTEYQENLLELKASNPRSRIYGMGILPRTVMTGVVDKNARIATACTNAGVTYWDTTGWIDPSTETSDGVHPTAEGHAKIAAQVLARL